ncbi:MAG: hypothetical protein ACRES9_02680 [Gammaproteobacteria bacterium]
MKTVIILFFATAIGILAGCTTAGVSQDEMQLCGPRPTQQQTLNAVAAYIQDSDLKDPASAQVKNVRVVGPKKMYKGLVNGGGWSYGWQIVFDLNAKNSFGGYVGYCPVKILREANGKVHWNAESYSCDTL